MIKLHFLLLLSENIYLVHLIYFGRWFIQIIVYTTPVDYNQQMVKTTPTSLNLLCLFACLHCSSLLAAAHTGLHERLILLFVEYYHHHSHCTPGSDALGGGASPYSPGNIIPPSPSNSDRANHSLRSYHKPSMTSSSCTSAHW
ncbi:hypothetical protein EB796_003785 [Bugula neritina]|uniref:Uncharacterized protein n=1 Tax=Bugula neritina TaxID=10212 RepID=A0A7J7KI01_BUGNE|nr:hypothetical protein EB796_003785 [Bugula neritina]